MAKEKVEKAVEAGSVLGKTLQEKQIDNLDKAKNALDSALEGYMDKINKLNAELVDLYYKIQDKETELKDLEFNAAKSRNERVAELDLKIKGLDKEFKTKLDDSQVSFDLAVKANKAKVMEQLMLEAGLAKIEQIKLEQLVSKANKLEEDLAKGFAAEVNKTKAILQKEHDTEVEKLKLTHEKEQSNNNAKIEQMESKVDFLEKQLEKAEKRVIDILENQVRIAQADKGIVVNTYDKK